MVTALASDAPMNASAVLVPELGGLATCLSCHAEDATLTNGAVAAGAGWNCRRCGQQWDASRLATVAAYDAWVSARAGA